jgi:uncharacterized protein (DUF488 family)
MTTRRRIEVATIGYQSATVRSFLEELGRQKVTLLIDVRAVASSRRPGFSKTALAANLEGAGIAYMHLRGLGTPAEGRVAARAGHHDDMKRIYRAHLKEPETRSEMRELAAVLRSHVRAALMCFEADPSHCHRTLILAALNYTTPLRVTHLDPSDV